jgi:hypothetical protein
MTMDATSRRSALWALFAAVAICVVLPHLPLAGIIARPLMWLSTLAHEGGHGVGAILVGGTFHKLQLFMDGSGVATSSYDSAVGWKQAVVSIAGLLGPAVCSVGFLWMGLSRKLARPALVLVAVCCAALLMVTAGFASVVAAVGAAIAIAVAIFASADVARVVCLVTAVELCGAVFTRGDYLFTKTAETGAGTMPSDVQHVALALGGHYLLWGAAIAVLSILLLALGLVGFVVSDRVVGAVAAKVAAFRNKRSKQATV